jgi:hypothetical protein
MRSARPSKTIFGDAAHHPVEITAIQSLKLLAHKLNQVDARGLLRHRPPSIPPPAGKREIEPETHDRTALLRALPAGDGSGGV